MSRDPFDDPQLDAAWNAFVNADARLAPAPELEAKTRERCQGVRLRGQGPLRRDLAEARLVASERRRAKGATGVLAAAAGLVAAASVAMAVFLSPPTTEPTVAPLDARGHGVIMLADTVSAERPVIAVETRTRRRASAQSARAAQPVELTEVLMQFDLAPMRLHEPLQMVRLRLPRGALQAFGLALLEPDAGGMVDVDVLVGEDGLPRDIRKVRLGQE